jgi:hypothetical protein
MGNRVFPLIVAGAAAVFVASLATAQSPGIGIKKDSTLTGTGSAGSPIGVNFTNVQKRIGNSCAAGSSIRAIDSLGNVTCETDDGPTISGTPTANRTAVWTGSSTIAESSFPCDDSAGTMSCGNSASDTFALTGALSISTDGDPAIISTTKGTLTARNIWIGDAHPTVTTAFSCVALGRGALASNQTAGHVVAIGDNAFTNLNGNALADSVAIGARAGQFTTTAGDLVFVGYRAGEANTSGNSNTIVGSETFLVNQTGSSNTGVGAAVLASNTGSQNTAIGQSAMSANTSGVNNIGIGVNALAASQTGQANIAIGFEAMKLSPTTGTNNIAVGQTTCNGLTSGTDNVCIGRQSMSVATTSNNDVAIGALALTAMTTGFSNTAVGYSSLTANTNGAANTAFGNSSGVNVTTGGFNTIVGYNTGGGISTGSNNTIIGAQIGSLAAGLANMVIIADGGNSNSIVFQARGGLPTANHGALQAGSTNAFGSVTGVGAFTSVTLTFSAAYTNRSRCFIQAISGVQAFTVSQSASAPVVSCFDMAGVAANCVDFSYECVGQ